MGLLHCELPHDPNLGVALNWYQKLRSLITALLIDGSDRLTTLRSRGHGALLAVMVEARKKAGYTQRQLGALLKRPQSYVGKIERGERDVNPMECAAWARACGVTPRAFFNRFAAALERRGI